MGERLNGIQEVRGSIPLTSTWVGWSRLGKQVFADTSASKQMKFTAQHADSSVAERTEQDVRE